MNLSNIFIFRANFGIVYSYPIHLTRHLLTDRLRFNKIVLLKAKIINLWQITKPCTIL